MSYRNDIDDYPDKIKEHLWKAIETCHLLLINDNRDTFTQEYRDKVYALVFELNKLYSQLD